jgi:branched-chain amino acid transport system permease protein
MSTMTPLADDVSVYLKRRARWSPLEIAFWVFAFATIWLFPGKYLIMKDTAILALFALSLDLILGYAGILSLGQAAFFGIAGYFSGLIAKYGIVNAPTAIPISPAAPTGCKASPSSRSSACSDSISTATTAMSIA